MRFIIHPFRKLLILITLLTGLGIKGHAQDIQYDPPWNEPLPAGVNFTVRGIDNVPDLYGDINRPQLVIFFAGNQYMVIDELLAAFKKAYPQYKRIFAETLPPGILMKQIHTGSLLVGNLRLSLKPDIYTAGKSRVEENKNLFSRREVYIKNKLAIMVYQGNPLHIRSLKDLGKKEVKVSMPNPAWEGIGSRIEAAYVKVGGKALKDRIMKEKVQAGTTILTKIHHRQTPMNIMYQRSDAGPVWVSEALYHQAIHHPVDIVKIPADQNVFATYEAGVLKAAPHPEAANDFLTFLSGATARAIYRKYGFENP